MTGPNPLAKPLDQLLEEVQGLSAVGSAPQLRSIMAVVAKCTVDIATQLGQVSAGLFDVKRQLVERVSELSTEVRALKTEVAAASTQGSAQTQALVRWTKVLVVVTGLYTLITGGLLIVALRR